MLPVPTPATAPPLPFSVFGAIEGRQVAEGKPVIFLRQREEVLVVREGDSVGGVYKVEKIAADRVDFLYVPLQQRQSLSFAP